MAAGYRLVKVRYTLLRRLLIYDGDQIISVERQCGHQINCRFFLMARDNGSKQEVPEGEVLVTTEIQITDDEEKSIVIAGEPERATRFAVRLARLFDVPAPRLTRCCACLSRRPS
jgi:hypothetical protein